MPVSSGVIIKLMGAGILVKKANMSLSEAVDIVARAKGEVRRTDKERAVKKHTGGYPNIVRPSKEELQQAMDVIPLPIRAFIAATITTTGKVPWKFFDETEEQYIERLDKGMNSDEKFWKSAILKGGKFPVPDRIKYSSARAWGPIEVGPGDLEPEQLSVEHEHRVHVEGLCKVGKKPNEEEKWLVLYPRAIARSEEARKAGPLEIDPESMEPKIDVEKPILAKETIEWSKWRIEDGWVKRRKTNRPVRAPSTPDSASTTGTEGSTPIRKKK
jgi:hypothetical protein